MTPSSRNPIAAAKAAKALVQQGAWRTLPPRDDKAKIAMALSSRLPWVLRLGIPLDALVAVGKGGNCYWCNAPAGLQRDEVTTTILGPGCGGCQVAEAAADVLVREREHVRQLVAAGFKPEATRNLRTPEQVDDYTRRLRALNAAKLPPRRPADPAYYQRRVTR
jgi:hypothetical protein